MNKLILLDLIIVVMSFVLSGIFAAKGNFSSASLMILCGYIALTNYGRRISKLTDKEKEKE